MSDRRIPFTKEDEDRIAGASTWATLVAIVAMVSAGISAGLTALGTLRFLGLDSPLHLLGRLGGSVASLVLTVLLGIWLIQSSAAFRKVARTDVADKAYLLLGFSKLHKFFLVTGIALIMMIVVTLVNFVLTFFVGRSPLT